MEHEKTGPVRIGLRRDRPERQLPPWARKRWHLSWARHRRWAKNSSSSTPAGAENSTSGSRWVRKNHRLAVWAGGCGRARARVRGGGDRARGRRRGGDRWRSRRGRRNRRWTLASGSRSVRESRTVWGTPRGLRSTTPEGTRRWWVLRVLLPSPSRTLTLTISSEQSNRENNPKSWDISFKILSNCHELTSTAMKAMMRAATSLSMWKLSATRAMELDTYPTMISTRK